MKISEIVGDIIEFSQLENNWDGYGGIPPLMDTIVNTLEVLNVIPLKYFDIIDYIAPTPYGTITIDFLDKDENLISIEIGKDELGYFTEGNFEKLADNVKINDNDLSFLIKDFKKVFKY